MNTLGSMSMCLWGEIKRLQEVRIRPNFQYFWRFLSDFYKLLVPIIQSLKLWNNWDKLPHWWSAPPKYFSLNTVLYLFSAWQRDLRAGEIMPWKFYNFSARYVSKGNWKEKSDNASQGRIETVYYWITLELENRITHFLSKVRLAPPCFVIF